MDLIGFHKKLSRLDLGELMNGAVLATKEDILDANTAQLSQGKNALGDFLQEYALDAYAEFKIALGSKAPKGTPDLFLEGDFYEGFILTVEGEDYLITSTDEKTTELTNKYGIDIFGLSEEGLQQVRDVILEIFLNNIRNGLL